VTATSERLELRVIPPKERRSLTFPAGPMPDIEAALAAPRVLAPELDRVTFDLHGVVTPSLARRVERRLKQLVGIIDARVDEVAQRLVVRLLQHQVKPGFVAALLADDSITAVRIAEDDPTRVRANVVHSARRLTKATVRSLVLLALTGLAALVTALDGVFNEQARAIALNTEALLATALLAWSARPTLDRALRRLGEGRPTPDSLPLAVGFGLYAASVGVFFTGGTPAFFASVLLVTVTIVGDWIGHRFRRNARAPLLAVRASIEADAVVAQPGGFYTVRPQDVSVGDTLLVRAGGGLSTSETGGATIAADGMCVGGDGVMVGPAFGGTSPSPEQVSAGSEVIAGATLTEGVIAVRVTAPNPRSSVARIADLVEAMGEHRALEGGGRPSQDQTWFEARTAWAVVIVSFAVLGASASVLMAGGDSPSLMEGAWGAALAVLAAGAPLAAARLWDPALLVTIGEALRRGVLVRDLRAAYRLAKLRRLFIERTGTLTAGKPEVEGWCMADGVERDRVLGLVLALEDKQRHPVARSLRALASESLEDVNAAPTLTSLETLKGRGVRARLKADPDTVVRLGGLGFMREEGIALEAPIGDLPTPEHGAIMRPDLAADDSPHTVVYLTEGEQVLARFHLFDPVRPDARRAVQELEDTGLELGLFTGDTLRAAQKVAEITSIPVAVANRDAAGLNAFIAEQTATDGEEVGAVTHASHVGEARRAAGTSIVLGAGIGAAGYDDDVVVMRNDLTALTEAIALSRMTRWRVRLATTLLTGYTLSTCYLAAAGDLPFVAACLASLAITKAITWLSSR